MSIQNRNFPFRRNTAFGPILVPAGFEPSSVAVGVMPDGITAFAAINSYPVWMRLVGGAMGPVSVTDDTGWLFPPGFFGIFSTQSPRWVSCVAVDRPGFPIADENGDPLYPDARLELLYGSGS